MRDRATAEARSSRVDEQRQSRETSHSEPKSAAQGNSARPADGSSAPSDNTAQPEGTGEDAKLKTAEAEQKKAEDLTDSTETLLKNADEVLASLGDEDWSALAEDVTALLGELKAKVDEGELSPELEQALHQLLNDLESGAPLDQVASSLEAIPLSALPELASQFPGVQNLRDALGRDGAAYLTQLSALAKQNPSGASVLEPGLLLTSRSAGEEGMGRLELGSLLELSTSAGKNGKDAFAQALQALVDSSARSTARASTSFDAGQSPANALAQLEGSGRSQPLTPTERGFTVQTDVRVPVNQGQWGQAVGQKVLWMASQKLSSAELRLDPPDLGPMQVRVSSHQDQISVTFTSPQAAVREALDQSANRLREMFAEQGLDLVDVNVSDQSGQEQAGEDGEGRSGGQGGQGEADDSEARMVEMKVSDRLVDHYA